MTTSAIREDRQPIRFAYHKAPALRSKPGDQRSILADILLQVESPPSLEEIVDQAEKAGYEETFRHQKQIVTMKGSVQRYLDRMVNSRQDIRDSV